jgi:hypothetical protein
VVVRVYMLGRNGVRFLKGVRPDPHTVYFSEFYIVVLHT